MTPKAIYLPGLNGLRAIAALAVVISHTTLALGSFGLDPKIFGTSKEGTEKGLLLASYGVIIFFTLSGFLITYLLLKEKETGTLKVKDFYIRRILRIWPLYYLYLGLCIITLIFFKEAYDPSAIPFYIFLAANIPSVLQISLPFLAHYWSLGVEEQFYLFFPQLAKLTNKKLFRIAVALILFILALKFVFWFLDRKYNINLPYVAINAAGFHTLLIGVVSAILYYNGNSNFIKITTHKITQFIAWACIFIIAINKFHLASVIDGELVSVISVFLIMGQVTKSNKIIDLENKVFDLIGKISYGIYVIHPLIIFFFAKMIGKFDSVTVMNYLLVYFSVAGITIFIAYLSYNYYEKIFLNLKAKYTTVKSTSTKD
jgi:peptidoglycan/LPS O-acetylase OafA/YrhL